MRKHWGVSTRAQRDTTSAMSFFHEDLEVLSALGYLKPRSLADTIADQRLLAAHAPATALGVGMHLTWMGGRTGHGETGIHAV